MSDINRRPIKARDLGPLQKLASSLAQSQITPNQISVLSIVFSLITPLALWQWTPNSWSGCLLAALGIQLRLLCNLMDGMVAIEGAKKSVLGDIYNEFPDRIADTIIILALGYTFPELQLLGWVASFVAVMTAYTRVLGAAVGTPHYFVGPMAKQHRMALISGILLICPLAELIHTTPNILILWGLRLMIFSGSLTVFHRLFLIQKHLKK